MATTVSAEHTDILEILPIIRIHESKLKKHIAKEFHIRVTGLGFTTRYGDFDPDGGLYNYEGDDVELTEAQKISKEEAKEIRIFLEKTTFGEDQRKVTEEDIIKIMNWLEKSYSDYFENFEYDEDLDMIVFKAKHKYIITR